MQTSNLKNWQPEKIRAEIILKRITQVEIARRCGRSPQLISRVINGQTISEPVHREIAKTIGRDIREIWPERYLAPSLV